MTDDLLDRAPCGFVSFSTDGVVESVNATLLEMLEYERHEIVGGHVERLLALASRIFYQTHFFPLVRLKGRADEIFLILRARSGSEVGVLANAARRQDDGRAVVDCVFLEVRERRRYEEELLRAKKQEESLRRDLERRKAELEAANRLLEEQAEELEAQQRELLRKAAELEETSAGLEASNAELLARSTELERLRVVAEEANQAKSNFLAVMSHELRTPLNAIAGYTQLIEMGIHGPVTPAQSEALDKIDRSQRHLLRLINDVLNLARIEAGRVAYDVSDVELAAAVAETMPMVEPQMGEKGLHFEMRVPPGLGVEADRDKLEQILLNLLINAIKFTPTGGRVTVEAVEGDDGTGRVLMRVSDTGIGIPPDRLQKVFEPFIQVDVSRTRATEGSGLGLTISRDLALGMGGDLTVRSVEGEGSTFTLHLPPSGADRGMAPPPGQ